MSVRFWLKHLSDSEFAATVVLGANLIAQERNSLFRKNPRHSISGPSLLAVIILTPALIPSAFAQQDPPAQNAAPPPSQPATSNDRLFDLLPNFLTLEDAGNVPPLTSGEKFKTVARGAFDWGQFVWYGLLSGLSQAENSEPGFGQGAEGYGKRYASAFADGTIENFMVGAALPSLFRQDPRFYQSSHGGFLHRLGYAASRILITRSDSGASQFNYSEVLGSAMASAISTYSYHPHSDRTVANTASVWGSQVGYDTISLVFKEFWPDIRRKLFRQHQPGANGH
jgi:hypothetical protein